MIDKHVLIGPDPKIEVYFKYSYDSERLIVGGHGRSIELIHDVVTEFIADDLPANEHKQRGRVRYAFDVSKDMYRSIKTQVFIKHGCKFLEIQKLAGGL